MTLDLEVEIASTPTPGLFAVEVDSPAGAASGAARLDVDRGANAGS